MKSNKTQSKPTPKSVGKGSSIDPSFSKEIPKGKKTIPLPEPKLGNKKSIDLPKPKLKSGISSMKKKGESGEEMEKRMLKSAFDKGKKPVVVKSLKRTTREIYKEPKEIETKKALPRPTSGAMKTNADRNMLYASYDLGFRRKNLGGQENPTPYPKVTPKKKKK
jgi:hypothetical protein